MKKRKLLTPRALSRLAALTELGVPLARAAEKLDISRPTAKKLLGIRDHPDHTESLFPEWLDPQGPDVQEQPDNYTYNGYFPLGYWEKCSDS